MNIETGDYIKHKPSGEGYRVAFIKDDTVTVMGWKQPRLKLSDCELVAKSREGENLRVIRNFNTGEEIHFRG